MARYVSIGNLFTGARNIPREWEPAEAPEMEYEPLVLVERPRPRHTVSGALGMPESQSGLVMVHKLDDGTDAKMNAMIDKVASLVSRRALIGLIIVAVVAFLIGKWLAERNRTASRRRSRDRD